MQDNRVFCCELTDASDIDLANANRVVGIVRDLSTIRSEQISESSSIWRTNQYMAT
jgi:hypothetical protein